MGLDKRQLLDQLRRHFEERLGNASRAAHDARDAAIHMATESEKKEDARAAIEFGGLAAGQSQRIRQAKAELEQIELMSRRDLPKAGTEARVALLSVVDVAIANEDGEEEERTFFVLPLGAGAQLTGPGGDGFLSVITPASPVGKALLGKRRGDSIDVFIEGRVSELRVVDVG